jgi:Gpi18-like mannosyltransferase
LAFDFIIIAALLKFFSAIKRQPVIVLFLLLNIAFIYNSLIWWQTDSIYTALVLMSIISALYNNVALAVLFGLLALNAKLNAIIYFPVIVLLLLSAINIQPKKIFVALLLSAATMLLIWYPFYAENNITTWITALQQRVNYYHFVSMKAYNFWYLFLDENPRNVSDSVLVFNAISYRVLGLILFVVAFVAALFPLLKMVLYKIKTKVSFNENEYAFIFLTLGLLTLIAMFFPTRIHERYAHAGVLFFFLYACYTGNFKLYVSYSIAYFINLEKEAQFLLLPNELDELIKPEYVAVVYLITGFAAYKKLYTKLQVV